MLKCDAIDLRANVMDIRGFALQDDSTPSPRERANAPRWLKAGSSNTVSPVRHNETGILLHIYHMDFQAQPVLLSKHMNINSLQSNQKDS
jgi:hypothetical protein